MPTFIPALQPTSRALLIILLLVGLVLTSAAMATEPKPARTGHKQPDSEWSAPFRFYQKTISRADGNRCAMHPSCSRYAQDAFKRHNFFKAWVLTSDRLLRCGHDETRLSPKVRVKGKVKSYDPLSANTFWWGKP